MAILRALTCAKREGWSRVCCESDAKAVIQSLNNPTSPSLHWTSFYTFSSILNICNYFDPSAEAVID